MPSHMDRELQIELARLQVDAQFLTTAVFGLVAVLVTVLVSLQQLVFSASIDSTIRTVSSFISLLVGGVGFAITALLIGKIDHIGKDIEGLKGKFVTNERPRKEREHISKPKRATKSNET